MPLANGGNPKNPMAGLTWSNYVWAAMLAGNFYTPDYTVNPADTEVNAFEQDGTAAYDAETAVSYTTIHPEDVGLLVEWKETLNTSAVVVADRLINDGLPVTDFNSVWTETDSGDWRGTMTFNDNSTSFETSPEVENLKYGNGAPFDANQAAGATNAWGIFTRKQVGNPDGTGALSTTNSSGG